jgi:hypothetical protein
MRRFDSGPGHWQNLSPCLPNHGHAAAAYARASMYANRAMFRRLLTAARARAPEARSQHGSMGISGRP